MVQTKRNPAPDYHPIAGDSARSGHGLNASVADDAIGIPVPSHGGTPSKSSATTQHRALLLDNRFGAIDTSQQELPAGNDYMDRPFTWRCGTP